MKDKNRWKGLEMHLLVCFIQAGLADSHRLAQSDDCFLNGMYRIGMREEFRTFSPRVGKREREAYQTWI